MTNEQIQVLLSVRGKSGAPLVDYTLVDPSDGLGARIELVSSGTQGRDGSETV